MSLLGGRRNKSMKLKVACGPAADRRAIRGIVAQQHTPIRVTNPLAQHWMKLAISRSGFGLAAVASLWDSVAES
jgi:hypothetical protein